MNIQEIRAEYPILDQKINGRNLIYLDNAATTHKPKVVVDALVEYYQTINSNVHRGVHTLSQRATEAFEQARRQCQAFINAKEDCEIIFTKGTTESMNLVAQCFGERYTKAGDEIVITAMEHHANIVPWQMLCERKGLKLKVIPINDQGELILDHIDEIINERTVMLSLAHISNVLGTVNPIKMLIDKAHQQRAWVMIDGAQAIAHERVDVQALDCDFYCFSAHKMYGPMGIGVLYGKRKYLEAMPPYQFGGEMIKEVTFEKTSFNELPYKFEAGTPNVADVIAFGRAIEYLQGLGVQEVAAYEQSLLQRAVEGLQSLGDVEIYGQAAHKAAVLSFNIKGIHHADLGTLLDQMGIAVRTGQLCAEPLITRCGTTGVVRASFAVYNTLEEVDNFIDAVKKAKEMLS